MATLTINDFLSIKSANIELRRINVFIGPQAQGKSIISKLIYFFKEFPTEIYDAVLESKDKRQFDSGMKSKFEKIFPSYAWEKSSFLVIYDNDEFAIFIENKKVSNKYKFSITYTPNVNKALSAGRKVFASYLDFESESGLSGRSRPNVGKIIRDAVLSLMLRFNDEPRMEHVIYIPAGRSFFANLQKSLFSFISSNIPIDYFLKVFGSIYETTREPNFIKQSAKGRPRSVQKLVDELLCGIYESEKGQDWIVGVRGKVSLSNSSSGQQEVLPMAIVLSTWPYIISKAFFRSFVIEEPEAHLFPVAQGKVVSLIAAAYNEAFAGGDFVITTHSPYILTAFNNLIQANNAVLSFGDESASEVYEVIPGDQHIRYEDVSAYIVNQGSVTSILDDEYRLIQADAIDEVSEHFSRTFEKLIEIESKNNAASERDDLI